MKHEFLVVVAPEETGPNEWEGVKILGYYADFIDAEEYAMTLSAPEFGTQIAIREVLGAKCVREDSFR